MEWGTEVALPLILCDEKESVVTWGSIIFLWSNESGDLVAEVGTHFSRYGVIGILKVLGPSCI